MDRMDCGVTERHILCVHGVIAISEHSQLCDSLDSRRCINGREEVYVSLRVVSPTSVVVDSSVRRGNCGFCVSAV